jgi:hypothetical protein
MVPSIATILNDLPVSGRRYYNLMPFLRCVARSGIPHGATACSHDYTSGGTASAADPA